MCRAKDLQAKLPQLTMIFIEDSGIKAALYCTKSLSNKCTIFRSIERIEVTSVPCLGAIFYCFSCLKLNYNFSSHLCNNILYLFISLLNILSGLKLIVL